MGFGVSENGFAALGHIGLILRGDPDRTWAAALEAAQAATAHGVELRVAPTVDDFEPRPADLSIPFVAYHFERTLEAEDLTTLRGRARAARQLTPILRMLPVGDLRSKLLEELERALGLPDGSERLLREIGRQDYMDSPEWDRRRRAALHAAGYRCQLCNGDVPLDVHHRTYERFGHEQPGDLIALCRKCHGRHHSEPNPPE